MYPENTTTHNNNKKKKKKKKDRGGSMRATYNTPLGYYTDKDPYGRGQFIGQWVYCSLSTAPEVFLIFTTQLYSYLHNYDAIVFIILREGSIATGILPTPNISLSSLPVSGKRFR